MPSGTDSGLRIPLRTVWKLTAHTVHHPIIIKKHVWTENEENAAICREEIEISSYAIQGLVDLGRKIDV